MMPRDLNKLILHHSCNLIALNRNGNDTNSYANQTEDVLNKKTKTQNIRRVKCKSTNRGKKKKSRLNGNKIVSHFLNNSSMYILKRIGKSTTSAQKLFWSVILILGITGFLSQIAQFLASYFNYPVLINLESISSNVKVFPAVTVCNINSIESEFEPCVYGGFHYDECIGANESHKLEHFNAENNTLPECDIDLSDLPTRNESLSNWFDLLHSQRYDSRIKYGHKLENLIQFCSYDSKLCSSKHFKLSRSLGYGNCYTFNIKNQKLQSTNYGPLTGLVLELNLETEKYSTFTLSVGAKVQIHDPYLEHSIDDKGIFISPGYETRIATSKTVNQRLHSPYKDHCKRYDRGDSQANCEELCYENITLSLCSCSVRTNLRSGVRECDLTQPLVWCCLDICDRYTDTCDCPLSCEETEYDIQVSTSVWPSRTHFEEYKDMYLGINDTDIISYDKFRETRLRLNVFYDNLDYVVYKQSPMYQSSQIFSQVGGQMGLWLGLSLVFIFECVETLFIICTAGKSYRS